MAAPSQISKRPVEWQRFTEADRVRCVSKFGGNTCKIISELKTVAMVLALLGATACAPVPVAPATNSGSATPGPTSVPGMAAPDASRRRARAAGKDVARSLEPAWTLPDRRRMRVKDFAGQVLILDFWATYCPPCAVESQHLVQLQKRFGAAGIKVIGLNVGGPDDTVLISDFVNKYRIQYEIAVPDQALIEKYMGENDVIPQTFVIDRKGRLVRQFVGLEAGWEAELEDAVKLALASGN